MTFAEVVRSVGVSVQAVELAVNDGNASTVSASPRRRYVKRYCRTRIEVTKITKFSGAKTSCASMFCRL